MACDAGDPRNESSTVSVYSCAPSAADGILSVEFLARQFYSFFNNLEEAQREVLAVCFMVYGPSDRAVNGKTRRWIRVVIA